MLHRKCYFYVAIHNTCCIVTSNCVIIKSRYRDFMLVHVLYHLDLCSWFIINHVTP